MTLPVWQTAEGFIGTSTERVSYTFTLTTVSTSSFSVISGSLPSGLTLTTDGIITGIPASVGGLVSNQFVVRAANDTGITDRTFILDTFGESNLTWVTPAGYISAGFGNEQYVINKEYVDFQFEATPGSSTVTITTSTRKKVNTLYVNTLTGVDAGQPGAFREIAGIGIQTGTTITNVISIFNSNRGGYPIDISLPTYNTASGTLTLFDSLPPGQVLRYYIEDGDGQLPPGLTLYEDGRLYGLVNDNLAVNYFISAGGYDDDPYSDYPYDYGVLFNGQYVRPQLRYIPKVYQFRVSISDTLSVAKRDFVIRVVDPSNLTGDTSYSDASGPLASESDYLVMPVWLGTATLARGTIL